MYVCVYKMSLLPSIHVGLCPCMRRIQYSNLKVETLVETTLPVERIFTKAPISNLKCMNETLFLWLNGRV